MRLKALLGAGEGWAEREGRREEGGEGPAPLPAERAAKGALGAAPHARKRKRGARVHALRLHLHLALGGDELRDLVVLCRHY